MYHIEVIPHILHFKRPAGTSRGVYNIRKVWYIRLTSDEQAERIGVGECAPLPDLSPDLFSDYEERLIDICRRVGQEGRFDRESLQQYPSILFGLETAFRHFEMNNYALWDTAFSRSKAGIIINGLIWMSDYDTMLRHIEEKIKSGFHCIKLKIGAIDFEEEVKLLKHIRNHFSASEIELRVDANGAFTPDEAKGKLERFAAFDIHSIEQPVRAGQWDEMARLTSETPVPIALDEELIGIHSPEEKRRMLQTIHPQYIILKPTLHGGISGSGEWINTFESISGKKNNWWVTSALESNIGLNAIAQWCATLGNPLPQGLGTGLLFTDNIPMPLTIRGDKLWFNHAGE